MSHRLERATRQPKEERTRRTARRRRPTVAQRRETATHPTLRRQLPPMARSVRRRLPNSTLRRVAAAEDAFATNDSFVRDLASQRGGGQSLDADLADAMGSSLGSDVSRVRIHADDAADRLATSIQARAFTAPRAASGDDIYFAQGEFDPGSEAGLLTLAHELAHVTDTQDTATAAPGGGLTVGAAHDPAEARADAAARSTVSALRRAQPQRAPVSDASATTTVRRQDAAEEQLDEEPAVLAPIRREDGDSEDVREDAPAVEAEEQAAETEVADEEGMTFSEMVAEAVVSSPALMATQTDRAVQQIQPLLTSMEEHSLHFDRTHDVYWGFARLGNDLREMPEGAETTEAHRNRFAELAQAWTAIQDDMAAANERSARRALAEARAAAQALQVEMTYAYRDVYAAGQDPSSVQLGSATLRTIADRTRILLQAINQADASMSGRSVTPLIPVLTRSLFVVRLITGWRATEGLASESEADMAALQNALTLGTTAVGVAGFTRFLPYFGHIGPLLNGIASGWSRVVSGLQERNQQWWQAREVMGDELPHPDAMPGGRAVFNYMRDLFRADAPPTDPPPSEVVAFFTENREMFSTVATEVVGRPGSQVPTTSSWILWTTADPARLNSWAFYNREMIWRLIYGRGMDLP